MTATAPRFALLGEPLAVDLVNTVIQAPDGLRDLLAEPARLRSWFEQQGERLDTTGSLPTFERVDELRTAVTAVLRAQVGGTRPDDDAVATVNHFAAGAPVVPQLVWDDAGPGRLSRDVAVDGADRVLGAIARSCVELLAGEERDRLHECASDRCILLFVATGRRRWCSPACGNRVRVARHYERTRSRDAAPLT